MKFKLRNLVILALIISLYIPMSVVYADDLEDTEDGIDLNIPNESPIGDPFEITNESEADVNTIDKVIQTPASVTGEVFQGSGTVTDFSTTGGRAFYTIRAQDNSIFYLIIDLEKTENNVYFLSEINSEELILAPASSADTNNSQQPLTPQVSEPTNESSNGISGDSLFYLAVVVMSCLILMYGFHKKVKKNNPEAKLFDSFGSIFSSKSQPTNEAEVEDENENDDIDYDEE